ncbi:MAG: agmatine deiminase family protein [Bacteroidales bacterium]|nr:agmatine deiminase family protein [Bacteroidales bacterium]MCF8399441.1 agmatine deiminase family protein [Bacteroidales bacterium]
MQFKYDPSYLRFKKYENKKTDGVLVAEKLGKKVTTSEIILDGGNVVQWENKIIMTTRIFSENLHQYKFDELISELERVLKVDKLILIPEQPHDFTGHSDGLVRFIDGDTVLINDNTKEKNKAFDKCLRTTLHNAGLKTVVLPTSMYDNQKHSDASGDYMNFLQMEGVIFMPAFGQDMDKEAEKTLRECFRGTDVIPVRCNELAKEGGNLNCVSWNVLE